MKLDIENPASLETGADYLPSQNPTITEYRNGPMIKYQNQLGILQEFRVINDDFTNMVRVENPSTSARFDVDLSHPDRAHLFPKSSK